MTQRLYYQDSFLREFDAQVLSVEPAPAPSGCAPDAQQWHVVLDRTAFYPTSGGQPHDTGKLAEVQALLLLATEAGHNYPGGGRGSSSAFSMRRTLIICACWPRGSWLNRVCGHCSLAARGGHVVFAHSHGLDADMNALLREVIEAAGGKGGSSKDFAQGSIANAGAGETVLDRASERLRG